MSFLKKAILTLTFLGCLIFLASCSNNEVSKLYKDKIKLANDNVYELVQVDDLVSKFEGTTDYVYAFYGSPESFETLKAITKVDAQAKQFKVERVYYLNEPDCNHDFVKEKLKLADPSWLPTIMVFKGGKLIFDTSSSDTRSNFFTEEAKGVDYDLVCGYIFRDLIETN